MTRNRIVVPGEPAPKQAPLFDTELVQREFLRVLKARTAWETELRLAQLRASMPREAKHEE